MLILKELKNLPILPSIIDEFFEIKNSNSYDNEKLTKIIEKNPFLVNRIFTLSNSNILGFSEYVDSINRAVSLYGINFICDVCIAHIINSSFMCDLKAYDCSFERYVTICDYRIKLLFEFEDDTLLKERLLLPLLLCDIGKFIISNYLTKKSKHKSFFIALMKDDVNLVNIEKDFVQINSSILSSMILKKYFFRKELLDLISYIDTPEKVNKKDIKLLSIIKIVCNIKKPFYNLDNSLAIEIAKNGNLDYMKFEKVILSLSKRYQ